MPHHVKRIARAAAAKTATYAGPAGELVMDITTNDLVLQNGQAGGVRLAKASTVIDAANGVNISTGGTLGGTTVVSGVDATTAAKGVVQLSNATDGTSQTMAATPKAVSDALQAAKNYTDTAVAGATPNVSNATGVLPIAHGGTGSSTKNFVDLTTAQTVAGVKTLTGSPVVKNNGPGVFLQQEDITKGTKPTANQSAGIFMSDSGGAAAASRTGQVVNVVDANGLTYTALYAYQFVSGATANAMLGVYCSADGTQKYATAPTPAANANDTKIATTAWVRTKTDAKADVSLGNVNSAGRLAMAHAAMPDTRSSAVITLSLPATGGTVTAPADGFVIMNASSNAANSGVNLSCGYTNSVIASGANQALSVCVMAAAGDTCRVSYYAVTNPQLFFRYANGSAPQP